MTYILPETTKASKKRQLPQQTLDRVASKVANLKKARTEVAEVQAYITELELEIKALLGDNEEGTINNVPVVRYQKTARIAWRQFIDDNPGIAKEYTVDKSVKALDEAAVIAAHPQLVEPYFIRNFTVL